MAEQIRLKTSPQTPRSFRFKSIFSGRLGVDALPSMVTAFVAVTAILNAWLYSSYASTPIVQADAWLFLENFLSHYYAGNLTFLDLFIQRGPGDHAQPVQKLILLFHTLYFDMDFRVEGLIGTAFATLLCWLVALQMRHSPTSNPRRLLGALLVGSVFALWLSLNANNIYTWSLVTMGFSAQVFACAFLGMFFWAAARGHNAWLFPAAIVLGLVIDEIAIMTIAVAMAAAFITKIAKWRPLCIASVASIAGLVVARMALSIIADVLGTSSTAIEIDRSLWGTLVSADVWQSVVVPLYTSLIYTEHLQKWFPTHLNAAIAATTVFMGLLHIYFWFSVYRMRRTGDNAHQTALAVGLMLLAYALTLGIVVTRVPEFGWSYLYQPRYVVFYQIATVAIVVLMHRRVTTPISSWVSPRAEAVFVGIATLVLLSTQVFVSKSSWQLVPYLTPYWQSASFALGQTVHHPEIRPAQCPSNYDFCNLDPARRAHLIRLLKGHGLNIFSPGFQGRNRLYPDASSIPGLAETPAKE